MLLSESELLPGEHVLVSKHANAVVGIVQAGPGSLGSVGMTGTEVVGGQLYLTDLRLIFRAHRVNRLQGGFTISLSSVTQVRDTSSGLRRQVEIVTPLERFTFVVWGVATLIARIEALRSAVAVKTGNTAVLQVRQAARSGRPAVQPSLAGPGCGHDR